MSDDIKGTLEQIQTAFTELKATNEQKLGEMATKGSVDTLIDTKLAAINETLTELEKKAARPQIGASEAEAADVEHKNAYVNWMRKGAGEDALMEIQTKAALTLADDSAGPALPRIIEAGIYASQKALSPFRALADVKTVSTSDYRWLSSDRNVGAGWVSETAARPATNAPQIISTQVPMGEIYANVPVSQQALDDVAFPLDQFVEECVSDKFNAMENVAFMTGDGVDKPKGLLTTTGVTTIKTGQAAAMPANGDYVAQMVAALPAPYRQGAVFMTSAATFAGIRTLKDSTGAYLYSPLTATDPAKLNGFEVVENEDSAAVAANSISLILGNFRRGYLVVDRKTITGLRDPYSNKPYVMFYYTKRVGGMVKDAAAFVFLKTAA